MNFSVIPAAPTEIYTLSLHDALPILTITGSNFGSSQGTGTVTFNGATASVTSWGASSIGVTGSEGQTTELQSVMASVCRRQRENNKVTPAITSLSITTGAGGAAVRIT